MAILAFGPLAAYAQRDAGVDTPAAQPSAGRSPAALDDGAGSADGGADIRASEAPGPAELLAWNRQEIIRLQGLAAGHAQRAVVIAAWPADLLELDDAQAALFGEDELTDGLADPAAVDQAIERARGELQELELALRDRQARLAFDIEQAEKAAQAAQRRPTRRGRRPRVEPEDPAATEARELSQELARAQRERLQAEILELESRVALIDARRAYLARSQPARRLASEREDEVLQRQIAEEIEQAERSRREAEQAQKQARLEELQAPSQAESALRAERARLEGIKAEQEIFRTALLQRRARLGAARARMTRFRDSLESLPDDTAVSARYQRVFAELDRVRAAALVSHLTMWRRPEAPSPGARLGSAVRGLPGDLDPEQAGERAALEEQRQSLAAAALTLDHELAEVDVDTAELGYQQAVELDAVRLRLLEQLGEREPGELGRRSRLSWTTAEELEGEAVQVAIGLLHWVSRRYQGLRDARSYFTDLSVILIALWWLVELPIVFFLVRFMVRRWDAWMLLVIELLGSSMQIDRWTMFLVRLVDFARNAGPALLVLLASVFVYYRIGGDDSAPEIRLLYIFVFWFAAFRFQLRMVESATRYVGALLADRASQSARSDSADERPDEGADDGADEGDGEDSAPQGQRRIGVPRAAPGASAKEMPVQRHLDGIAPVPGAGLVIRTWRVFSGYIAVVILLLDVVDLALGHGILFSLIARFAWWGAVPLAIFGLRAWRSRIIDAYTGSWADDSRIAIMTRRHAERFYGLAVVAFALVVTTVRRIAEFARRNLSNLDATKRLFSFVFRRRVEAHAAEHGRVLDEPQELPQALLSQFPSGPLDDREQIFRPAFVDEIAAAFHDWDREHIDGSVMLVGGTGMGKSTAFGLLEETLGEPILRCRLQQKYTDEFALMARLSEILGVESGHGHGEPGKQGEKGEKGEHGEHGKKGERGERHPSWLHSPDESAFITRLTARMTRDGRRIIALDDCHNLFLRQVGGFAAWDAFTRIVNASSAHIFWILTCNDVAWNYLSNIAAGVSYFGHVVEIPRWSHDELRTLVLTRMRRARYRTNFTDLLVTRLQGVNASTQIIRTSQGYFRLLSDVAAGNPRMACHFWLRSLVPDASKRQVRVHLFAAPSIEELEKLPDDIAFILAAVVEHESLTAGELAEVSNISPEFCRFALRYCRERGYMFRSAGTGRTKLTTHWHHTIVRFLKRKHLLYS